MTARQLVGELIATTSRGRNEPTPWAEARRRLHDATTTYWLATTAPNGTPHVRPLLAVWVADHLHFASGSTTAKTHHLASRPWVAVTVSADGIDLVVEGRADRIRDQARLQRVADAYAAKYGWFPTARDGAFHDIEGAPSAGPAPYEVYAVSTARVFGFPAGESFSPTRWQTR
jgi:general stress protein 26